MNLIVQGFEHVPQELPSRLPARTLDQLGHGEHARAVNADEQKQLALNGLPLAISMWKKPRVARELRPLRLVALDVKQARNALTLRAPVQCLACKVRKRRL